MNNSTIKEIIQLNKDFYKKTNEGKSFSGTRQSSWMGWKNLASVIKNNRKSKLKSVLDVGCGNGRFYNELIKNENWKKLLEDNFTYIGVDSDKDMLEEGRGKYKKASFIESDVITKPNSNNLINKKCDLVVSFGVSHHVPSEKLRLSWFLWLANLVDENGILCITTWLFVNAKQFKTAKEELKNKNISISKGELDKGDYFLGWNKQNNLYRYCHSYSDSELSNIDLELRRLGFILNDTYLSDGKNNNLNKYLVYKKY